MKTRKQLTLFVEEADSKIIEEVRKKYNPIQFKLIPCHVTLCREDELLNLREVVTNLRKFSHNKIHLRFDYPIRIKAGKGVILPGEGENQQFRDLRKSVLDGIIKEAANHEPHITLMHPRNSTCTNLIFEEILKYKFPSELNFQSIYIIEQFLNEKWKILKEFKI